MESMMSVVPKGDLPHWAMGYTLTCSGRANFYEDRVYDMDTLVETGLDSALINVVIKPPPHPEQNNPELM